MHLQRLDCVRTAPPVFEAFIGACIVFLVVGNVFVWPGGGGGGKECPCHTSMSSPAPHPPPRAVPTPHYVSLFVRSHATPLPQLRVSCHWLHCASSHTQTIELAAQCIATQSYHTQAHYLALKCKMSPVLSTNLQWVHECHRAAGTGVSSRR